MGAGLSEHCYGVADHLQESDAKGFNARREKTTDISECVLIGTILIMKNFMLIKYTIYYRVFQKELPTRKCNFLFS